MNHHIFMAVLEVASNCALFIGMALVIWAARELHQVERAILFDDVRWSRGISGMAIGIVLTILGIVGLICWWTFA